jgi:flagellar export protein FliJ
VRVVRERKEKIAQRELAEAISRRSSTVAELRSAEHRAEHARAQQRSAGAGGDVSATDLLAHQVYVERTEAQRYVRARELEQREAEVAQRDADLTTAATEHRMLERLRDRRRSEHDSEDLRRELGALDEIAALRFSRSRA